MKSLHSTLTQIQSIVVSRIHVDARGLAVFRIAMGTVLLSDLLLRARTITVFYTDTGVLPRDVATTIYPWVTHLSIHTISGAVWYQSVLFIIGGICAVSVIIGYRTRMAVILSWVLLVSLHARNPIVLNAGDSLLRRLLFWGAFLPLGHQWSIDAVKKRHNTNRERTSRITRVGSAGLLTQVVLLYVTNGVLKLKHGGWGVKPVVGEVFQLDAYTTGVGVIVSQHPIFLRIGGYVWVMMLLGSGVLLVTRHWKRVIIVAGYMFVHTVMAVTMTIGLFPLISITALIPFLPPIFWEAVTQKTSTLKRRTVGINISTTPYRKSLNALWSKPTVNSSNVQRNTQTCINTLRKSASWCVVCIGIAILIGMVVWNAAAVGVVTPPDTVAETVEPEDNSWDMFASVSDENVWVIANAITQHGNEVDLIRGEKTQFTPPNANTAWYPTTRWRKYLYSTTASNNEMLINSTINGVCRVRTNKTRREQITTLSLYEIKEPINTYNENEIKMDKITTETC